MSARKTVILSATRIDRHPWYGGIWEWENVVAAVEHALILAPENRLENLRKREGPVPVGLLAAFGARMLRRQYMPLMESDRLGEKCDLLLYTCQFIEQIEEIERIRDWRQQSEIAVLYLMECWTSSLPRWEAKLRLLDKFDHVFVLNGSCIEPLARYTSTPVTQLSTATDTILTAPSSPDLPRGIDVSCFGRREEQVHHAVKQYADRSELVYIYDVWKSQIVRDSWQSVREFNARIVKQSKYYLAWNPAEPTATYDERRADQVLSTRYFEGAAGGAVILGTAPDCKEFRDCFDWPDAVIPLQEDVGRLLDELEGDPARVRRTRTANIVSSLARHDWCHRWKAVLDVLGLPLTNDHVARLTRLAQMAVSIAAGFGFAELNDLSPLLGESLLVQEGLAAKDQTSA